jgi:putative ABC transport system permease protein
MFRNYLKTSIRNLLRYKFISAINLFGLTVGLTCCLLILSYIVHELSYDKYNVNADRVYRVTRTFYSSNGAVDLRLSAIAPPFGPLLKNDFPDIESYTRLLENGPTPVRYKEKVFNEQGTWYADENLFKIFSVKTLEGNPASALSDPFTVMLTPAEARKYFGSDDAINKVLVLNNQYNLKVTGIFEPFPATAHIHPDIMISFSTLNDSSIYGLKGLQTNYGNNAFYTYILLPKNYPTEKITNQFPAFIDNHLRSQTKPEVKQSKYTSLALQKLTDIHLRSHYDDEAEVNGNITTVYVFAAIAFFILLIACINYMNLSTARSALRSREIGVRKVVGAQRKELVMQFLFESVFLSWVAMLLAVVLTILLIPVLNKLTAQELSAQVLLQSKLLIPLILIPFIVGIISGIYPALFLSSFRPVLVLKGIFRPGSGNLSFRKVLVVTQFAISIILIICTGIVFRQLNYVMTTAPGFDKDQVVTMSYDYKLEPKFDAFRNELLQKSTIRNVARSSRIPTGRLLDDMGAQTIVGDSMHPTSVDVKFVAADYDFLPTYGVKLVAGRNFSRDFPTDSNNYVLNEAAVKMIGWKNAQSAIDQPFKYGGVTGKIIGVMSDFHFESMHQPIIPLVLIMGTPVSRQYYGELSVKLAANNTQAGLNDLQQTMKDFLPNNPFDYTFLDDNFAHLYDVEDRERNIFTIFSCIAIFIACLGLLGLSAFTIAQRFKEIGIRKVLGASVSSIVSMLSKDFLKLILIASLISFPIAWYSMNQWLQSFAYRIDVGWMIFPIAAIIASIVAFLTISFQAIKAAIANPVKSLRTE